MDPYTRKNRIQEIKNIVLRVHHKDETINMDSFINELMAHYDAKRQTVMEYLEILIQQGFLLVDLLPELKKEKNFENKPCIRVHAYHKICWANPNNKEVIESFKYDGTLYS